MDAPSLSVRRAACMALVAIGSHEALEAVAQTLLNGPENMFTRVFGRLTAWQNWIFQRPNTVGGKGALKVYGTGEKAAFDWTRV